MTGIGQHMHPASWTHMIGVKGVKHAVNDFVVKLPALVKHGTKRLVVQSLESTNSSQAVEALSVGSFHAPTLQLWNKHLCSTVKV